MQARRKRRGSRRTRTEMSFFSSRTANTVYRPTSRRTPSATGVPLKRLSFAMIPPPLPEHHKLRYKKTDRAFRRSALAGRSA